jgi:hypothetical protein
MKTRKASEAERQMDSDATDFAQEVNYAVAHHGRELHPEQQEKRKSSQKDEQPATPWQID